MKVAVVLMIVTALLVVAAAEEATKVLQVDVFHSHSPLSPFYNRSLNWTEIFSRKPRSRYLLRPTAQT